MFTQDQINNKKALIGKISNGYKIDKNDLIIDTYAFSFKYNRY